MASQRYVINGLVLESKLPLLHPYANFSLIFSLPLWNVTPVAWSLITLFCVCSGVRRRGEDHLGRDPGPGPLLQLARQHHHPLLFQHYYSGPVTDGKRKKTTKQKNAIKGHTMSTLGGNFKKKEKRKKKRKTGKQSRKNTRQKTCKLFFFNEFLHQNSSVDFEN